MHTHKRYGALLGVVDCIATQYNEWLRCRFVANVYQLIAQCGVADLVCEGWARQTTDGVLDSKARQGPCVLYDRAISVLAEEVKLVAAGQKKRRGS